ncbi:hypothetical protein [Pyrobaculum islandicum]|uniref:hypothetical protein n=1 Tax=Pyrobaculum islandicum TaxID=2277 RepID=UPI001FD78DE8|nr:hypothetical protein [Pyrobaculum islandicum]
MATNGIANRNAACDVNSGVSTAPRRWSTLLTAARARAEAAISRVAARWRTTACN